MSDISEAAKKAADNIQIWRDCVWDYRRRGCREDCPVYSVGCNKGMDAAFGEIIQQAIDTVVADKDDETADLRRQLAEAKSREEKLRALVRTAYAEGFDDGQTSTNSFHWGTYGDTENQGWNRSDSKKELAETEGGNRG